jgi:hypothetical protein
VDGDGRDGLDSPMVGRSHNYQPRHGADPAAGGFGSGVRLAGASVVGGQRWSPHLPQSVWQGVSLEAIYRASGSAALDRLVQRVVIGQVVKRYERRRVVDVERRLKRGSFSQLRSLLDQTQGGGGVLNTAYIERLNATFRARLAVLARRTRGLARQRRGLHAGMYLVGTVYNFCAYQASLSTDAASGPSHATPAMAAGLTSHRWSMTELVEYRVPGARWQPPKRRGRRSKAMQQLIDRWAA